MSTSSAFSRREFLAAAAAGSAGLAFSTWNSRGCQAAATPSAIRRPTKDDISLAQWALIREVLDKTWTTDEFPRVAREDFDINGIEFVSTLFDSTEPEYLDRLRRNAEKHQVQMVLIMVDQEGETCDPDPEVRKRTAENHHKWVDVAKELGCHSIRTNCRGPRDADPQQMLEWSADCYNRLLEYAAKQEIGILIENHGGISNDPEWMVSLFEKVNNPWFGAYPDWRSPPRTRQRSRETEADESRERFDNVAYLQAMIPYSAGMSYRNQPTEEQTAEMIRMCLEGGYHGFYAIESGGRDGIRQGKEWLEKYVLNEGRS